MMYSNNFESSFHWGSKFGSNTENASEPLQSLTKHSGELFSTSKGILHKKKKQVGNASGSCCATITKRACETLAFATSAK